MRQLLVCRPTLVSEEQKAINADTQTHFMRCPVGQPDQVARVQREAGVQCSGSCKVFAHIRTRATTYIGAGHREMLCSNQSSRIKSLVTDLPRKCSTEPSAHTHLRMASARTWSNVSSRDMRHIRAIGPSSDCIRFQYLSMPTIAAPYLTVINYLCAGNV